MTAIDSHWIWQDGQALTTAPLVIRDGAIAVPQAPGLGVTLDMAAVAQAQALHAQLQQAQPQGGDRDDALAMQQLLPGWRFDPRRPCLVR